MLIEASMGVLAAGIGLGLITMNKQKLGTSKLGKSLGEYEGKRGVMVSKNHCISKASQNILFIAPPGFGKSTCGNINNLLSPRLPRASKIIFDIKGEIYDITHKYRESLGEECIVWEPLGDKAKWNPLDFCEEFSDFRDLAYIILSNGAKGIKDETWINMSMPLLTSMLLYANHCGGEQNTIEFALDTLIRTDEADLPYLLADTKSEVIAEQYALYQKAKRCGDTDGSIQSTVAMNTALFSDPRIKRSTSESTFNFKDLRDKNRVINIFIKYPIDKAGYLSSLMSIFFSKMAEQLVKHYEKGKSQNVLIFADELQNLGHIPRLREYMAYMRYAKIGVIGSIQTISGLYDIYGKYAADSILGCFNTVVLFPGNKDTSVLELYSRLSGETEIKMEDDGREYKTKKMLFTSDELRRLKSHTVLIVCANNHYVIDKADYWKDRKIYVRNQEVR